MRTRERFRAQAEAVGYVLNCGSASRRTAISGTAAIIYTTSPNPYFAVIVAAIQNHQLDSGGMATFLADTGDLPERQASFVAKMHEYNVDGINMSPASGTDPRWFGGLAACSLPCALFPGDLSDSRVDYAGGDFF